MSWADAGDAAPALHDSFGRPRRFVAARVVLDRARLAALAPWLRIGELAEHLAQIPRIAAGGAGAGPIGALPQYERFHWLVAPRSAIIQTSPVHTGRCTDGASALQHIMRRMVWPPEPRNLAK